MHPPAAEALSARADRVPASACVPPAGPRCCAHKLHARLPATLSDSLRATRADVPRGSAERLRAERSGGGADQGDRRRAPRADPPSRRACARAGGCAQQRRNKSARHKGERAVPRGQARTRAREWLRRRPVAIPERNQAAKPAEERAVITFIAHVAFSASRGEDHAAVEAGRDLSSGP